MRRLSEQELNNLTVDIAGRVVAGSRMPTANAMNLQREQIRCLIAEVRDWRRRSVTSERYDNELVIAEDERRSVPPRGVFNLAGYSRSEMCAKYPKHDEALCRLWGHHTSC